MKLEVSGQTSDYVFDGDELHELLQWYSEGTLALDPEDQSANLMLDWSTCTRRYDKFIVGAAFKWLPYPGLALTERELGSMNEKGIVIHEARPLTPVEGWVKYNLHFANSVTWVPLHGAWTLRQFYRTLPLIASGGTNADPL